MSSGGLAVEDGSGWSEPARWRAALAGAGVIVDALFGIGVHGPSLAVRAFDADGMMTGWEMVEGRDLEAAIERLFANPDAAYLHIHYAAPGCYAARIDRA